MTVNTVLRLTVCKVQSWILTALGLLVRKSRILLQTVVLIPNAKSLLVSVYNGQHSNVSVGKGERGLTVYYDSHKGIVLPVSKYVQYRCEYNRIIAINWLPLKTPSMMLNINFDISNIGKTLFQHPVRFTLLLKPCAASTHCGVILTVNAFSGANIRPESYKICK